MANWLGSHVFVDMAWEPTQMMTRMWRGGVDAMSDDDLDVRSWRDATSHDDMDVRSWRGCHVMPRHLDMFMSTLYDYRFEVLTSRPQRQSVRYKLSVITQKLVVIVVLNDSNNNHK